MALTGPHIDGERPAYPADSVVARDPEEARRAAERNIADGAVAIKIYFRLPLASARAVVDVCRARDVPCTAHLEILDARDILVAGLDGIEHITSFGTSVVPRRRAEHTGSRSCSKTMRGATAAMYCSQMPRSMGQRLGILYEVLRVPASVCEPDACRVRSAGRAEARPVAHHRRRRLARVCGDEAVDARGVPARRPHYPGRA